MFCELTSGGKIRSFSSFTCPKVANCDFLKNIFSVISSVQAHGRRIVKFFCDWLSQDDLSFHKLGKCLRFIYFPVILQRSSLRTSPWIYFDVGNIFSSGFSPGCWLSPSAHVVCWGRGACVCMHVYVCVNISPSCSLICLQGALSNTLGAYLLPRHC